MVDDHDEYSEAKNNKRRRWRLAFTAISFTRALVSLSRKVLTTNAGFLRSVSYVTIDVAENVVQLSEVDQKTLNSMVREKNFECLTQFGGVEELATILKSDVAEGVNGAEVDVLNRRNVFGMNKYQKPPTKSFLSFVVESFKDLTIIILLICAILSLGFGIKQRGWDDGWFDGGSIIVAVFLVVAVSAISNYKQSKQFEKLSAKSVDINVEVVRAGRRQPVSIFDVVVGDLVCLKIGDQIPADGVCLECHSLKVDDSSMTGESDYVDINHNNPFLLSGTKVMDGFGLMLVT